MVQKRERRIGPEILDAVDEIIRYEKGEKTGVRVTTLDVDEDEPRHKTIKERNKKPSS